MTQSAGVEKLAYTIPEFMEIFGTGRFKTYEEIRAGRLKIKKVGRRTLISKADAENWFNNLPNDIGSEPTQLVNSRKKRDAA